MLSSQRPVELGIAEAEHAPVRRDQPVPSAIGGGGHADDRLVQPDGLGRSVERGIAEAEHAPVRRDQPVPSAIGGGGHADDRLVQPDGLGRSVERGIAEAEHAPVRRDQPVPSAIGGGGHADDRLVQPDGLGRSVELGIAEAEHASVLRRLPVAVAVSGRCHSDGALRDDQRGNINVKGGRAEPRDETGVRRRGRAARYPVAATAGCGTDARAVRRGARRTAATRVGGDSRWRCPGTARHIQRYPRHRSRASTRAATWSRSAAWCGNHCHLAGAAGDDAPIWLDDARGTRRSKQSPWSRSRRQAPIG